MHTKRKRSVTALTAAIALVAGVAPAVVITAGLPGTTASAASTGLGSTTDGYLVIERSPVDQIELYDASGTSLGVQTINASAGNCALVTSPSGSWSSTASYLKFNGQYVNRSGKLITDVPSWLGGSIGVAEKTSGTSCYQVNVGEILDIGIGPAAKPSPTGTSRFAARSANLDVELKQDARILATATLGGAPVAYFELQSGSTIGASKITSGVIDGLPYAVQPCNNPSDSGPDAGVKDNCRWAISAPVPQDDDGIMFDSLSLKSMNGSFSLEYGRDGNVTSGVPTTVPSFLVGTSNADASFFELTSIDGVLDCNTTTITRDPDPTTQTPKVTVRRLPNATTSGQALCSPVPYTLKNSSAAAQFLKPLYNQTTAQFVMDMTWTVPLTSSPETLPATYANYETGGGDIKLGWCPDPVYSSGNLIGVLNPLTNSAVVDQDKDRATALPDTQFSCVGVRNARVVDGSPDRLELTEQIYVLGDIALRK